MHWRDGPAVSNEDRIVSPYDPDARSSRKRNLVWLGYKVHLTETCDQDPTCPHLVTHVETTPATLQDLEALAPIGEQLRAKALAPASHYGGSSLSQWSSNWSTSESGHPDHWTSGTRYQLATAPADRLCPRRLCHRLARAASNLSARTAQCGLDPAARSTEAPRWSSALRQPPAELCCPPPVYPRARGPYAHPHAPRGACRSAAAASRAKQPSVCTAVRPACRHRGDDLASGAHHAGAPQSLCRVVQNASASPRSHGWSQCQAHRCSSPCAISRQTHPSRTPEITVRSLTSPRSSLMFNLSTPFPNRVINHRGFLAR